MPEYCWEGYNGESPQPTLTKNECGSCNAIVLGQVNEETTSESGCLPCNPDGAYNSSWQNNYDPNQWDPLGNAVLEYCSDSAGGWKLFMWDHHPNDTYDGIDSGAWIYCPGSFNDNCGTNILAGCLDIAADNYDRNSNVPCFNCCEYPNPTGSDSTGDDGGNDDDSGDDGDGTGPGISNELDLYEGVLFVNQIMTGGDNVYESDWIEIYNSHTEDINLSGFRFGDNHYPERWCDLVDRTIPAGGFLVVSYSNDDCGTIGENGWVNIDEKLGGGDTINFYDPDGNIVDVVENDDGFGEHIAPDDQSYGRCGNGGEWGQIITEPTPGFGVIECAEIVYGCTDETACNYVNNATDDDGSCVFPIECSNTSPTFICLDTCPPIGTEQILINEISTKGTSHTLVADDIPETDVRDWVELYNPTNLPIDLNGWTFTDGDYPGEIDQRNILNEEFIIPAKGFAIVVADDCDGNTNGPWFDRYCEDHPGEGPGDQNILPGEGVQVDRETGNTASDTDLIWDRIYPNYPYYTPGVIRVSFKIGGTDSFKIYNGDPQNGGILVDQFSWIGNPSEEGESYARLWDGGPWGEIKVGDDVTYGTSNGIEPEEEPVDDSEVTYSQTLNLVTIEGTYRIDGLDGLSPENDVISIIYAGKSYQITNSNFDSNGKVSYSVTFNGEELLEYAVGFNLKTKVDDNIIVLRSSEVVPVTNIFGGQIRYDITFIYDFDSLLPGCTDPTSPDYSNEATIDDGTCTYTISGCTDSLACTCDNTLCLQFCNFCGTDQEYLCVGSFGFYNQNPNATGGECQYPQNPITIGFENESKIVENFTWVPEYRLYSEDSNEEFMYTYLPSDNFNNNIEIDMGGNLITNYSFEVDGVHFRECQFTEDITDCEINTSIIGTKTSIIVLCQSATSSTHTLTCSVDDIITLHSCIINPFFLGNGLQVQTEFTNTCFDLNPLDNLKTRLIKLNKLNNKLYTHIADLHRGKNKFSTPVLAPFCCKNGWELQQPNYDGISPELCEGTLEIYDAPIDADCTGEYQYTCGAPNSGDINASGNVNVQDLTLMIDYLLYPTQNTLDGFLSASGIPIYSTDNNTNTSLCNWNSAIYPDDPFSEDEINYAGIADLNGDGVVDILDIIILVDRILEGSNEEINNIPLSVYTGDCRELWLGPNNMGGGPCFVETGCIYTPAQPSTTTELDCADIFRGMHIPYGYPVGECPSGCNYTEETVDTDNPYVPGTDLSEEWNLPDRIVHHSSELLKCGDSIPQLGIINPLDFWDFDMPTLLNFYESGKFLEYRSECNDLGGTVHPSPADDEWRGITGPFRDNIYQLEYLGTDIGYELFPDATGPQFIHGMYGPLQLIQEPITGLFRQFADGTFYNVSGIATYPGPHAHTAYMYLLCNSDGFNGVQGTLNNNPPLITDEFCGRVEPSDYYTEGDPYGWAAKACCQNGETKKSFKIPFYGIIPFFNTEDYFYKYSASHIASQQYSMGYVPPCKEFLYDKITTALAFDESLTDGFGFSYSIKTIEYETELISHVIITGETLPTIWLGTLTDLNLGEGYNIHRFTEFGSPITYETGGVDIPEVSSRPENISRLLWAKFQMEYDECGICSNGSALHISNSDKDSDDVCCLYPNKVINYYLEDNQFNTAVGKTYLDSLKLCDSNDSIVIDNDKTYHSEYNSDNCPGTLDCLGICHEELTIDEASLLTIYAQIDQYGGCCLQGNIDLCGVCDGDSSSCDTTGWTPSTGFFELDILNTTQVTPSVGDENYNIGTLDVQINSDTDMSEIKFEVVGLNIPTGGFMVGSENPDFNIYVTPTEGGTDVVIASILSTDLFPSIPAGTFSIRLEYDDIVYSTEDFILNESKAYIDYITIQGMKLNQFIQSNNSENLYTTFLYYYGCSESTSVNYDVNCYSLGDGCTQFTSTGESYCLYSFLDCNGDVDGTASLNICGICVGGNTFIDNSNGLGGFYGQDCNNDCFGTAYTNNCTECVMGNTGLPYNQGQDCYGVCSGDATIDDCGVCNSPLNQNMANGGCGCFVPAPVEHYLDNDLDGLGVDDSETNEFYCLTINPIGELTYFIAPFNYSPIAGDTDPICPLGTQYDCDGNCIINEFVCLGELSAGEEPGSDPVCDIDMVNPLILDECGECDGPGPLENFDCDGNCTEIIDCAGACDGNAEPDCLGNCNGLAEFDCSGTCNGTHTITTYYYDGDGDGIGCEEVTWIGCSNNIPSNYVDSSGEEGDSCNCPDLCNPTGFPISGGTQSCLDECGICEGENLDQDCAGDCFGTSLLDECGTCYDSAIESPLNACIGCMYPTAGNYDESYTISCENCCDFDDYIESIYENPAIYIRGSNNVSYIGFLLPKTTSSSDLICAGTYGESPAEDDYCATSASEGDDCNLLPPSECIPAPVSLGPPYLEACGCQDNNGDGNYDGYPDCELLANNCGWPTGICQSKGTCEQYEVHRILKNSFYSDNPDNPTSWGADGSCGDGSNPPCLQSFVPGDKIYTRYQTNFGEDIVDGLVNFDGSTQKWKTTNFPDNKNIFKRSRGYYMNTTNSGWLKINAGLRNILNIQED